jgi:hypothetical protein
VIDPMTALHVVDVDGVAYRLKRIGPFDALRFDTAGSRLLGPLLRALALSDNAKGVIQAMTGGDHAKIAEVLESDVGAALAMLGIGIDGVADRLDADVVIDLVRRMFIGRLVAPHPILGTPVEIADDDTYEQVIGHQMAVHGHLHQLKLLWAALRVNLGPTSAGSTQPTTTPKA